MKKQCRQGICLLSAVLLLMGGIPAAFAAGSCDTAPLIVVTGMNAWPLVLNAGTDQEKQVFAPDTQAILKLVGQIAGPVANFAVTKDYDKLGDDVLPAVYALFEPLACEPDGSSRYAITTTVYPESMENYPEFVNEEGYLTNELPLCVRPLRKSAPITYIILTTTGGSTPWIMRKNCVAMWSAQSVKLAMIR